MTREEAIIILGNIPIDGKDKCYSIAEYQEAKTMAIEALKQEPKTGHWIMDRQRETRQCDKCMTVYRWSFNPHNYCPNCGAEMKEGE